MLVHSLPAAESLARYELRFQSLFHAGRALAFPCDRQGEVQWDAMIEGARANFLRAQGSVGRMPHDVALKSIELFGTKVAPIVREEVSRREATATV